MIPWWAMALLVLGANFALWGSVGLIRLAGDLAGRVRSSWAARRRLTGFFLASLAAGRRAKLTGARSGAGSAHAFTADDVAVLIPAHNEAVVIGESLAAIMRLVPRGNVHVVSDGSTDGTVRIARAAGAKVIETASNVGKAGALQEAVRRFRLVRRFPVLMLLDADTRVQPGYFQAALPLFDQPGVVAVAGCVRTAAGRRLSFTGKLLVSHRQRIYAIAQRALKFGQTWQRLNATHIVPGFASLYLTEILPRIEMNPPGLVIEDFNMTFEVYQKRLGKVAFSLKAVAVTQDPDNFHDYVRQTRRWAVGLWQTVRRHRPQANLFTVMLVLLLLEVVTSSVLFVLLPFVLLAMVVPDLIYGADAWPVFAQLDSVLSEHLTLAAIGFGVVVPDLAMTVVAALVERRPLIVAFAPFYLLMRLVDSVIGLAAIPVAYRPGASGRWRSPARRAVPPEERGPERQSTLATPLACPATAPVTRAGLGAPERKEPASAAGYDIRRNRSSCI